MDTNVILCIIETNICKYKYKYINIYLFYVYFVYNFTLIGLAADLFLFINDQ